MPIPGANYRDGVAYIDGAMCVTPVGSANITGGTITGATGVTSVIGASWTAVVAPADTNENVLATINIPAGTLGTTGGARVYFNISCTNNANVKTVRVRYSGIGGGAYFTRDFASTTGGVGWIELGNRGATNSQIGGSRGLTNANSSFVSNVGTTSVVDTTAATTIVITAQKATAGDTVTLEYYIAERVNA